MGYYRLISWWSFSGVIGLYLYYFGIHLTALLDRTAWLGWFHWLLHLLPYCLLTSWWLLQSRMWLSFSVMLSFFAVPGLVMTFLFCKRWLNVYFQLYSPWSKLALLCKCFLLCPRSLVITALFPFLAVLGPCLAILTYIAASFYF